MNSFMDAKLMAKLLRQGLAERDVELGHSECLELVARQFGVANWNILSAHIEAHGLASAVPEGWHISGRSPMLYRFGLDQESRAAWIQSKAELHASITGQDFCTLMQSVDAAEFRGKRLQLRALLKAQGVQGGVTIWLRIDGPQGALHFDNLEHHRDNGPVAGDSAWVERQITLDVPEEASSVNFGFYLKGAGKGLARRFELDNVGATIPVSKPDGAFLPKPTNLGFFDAA